MIKSIEIINFRTHEHSILNFCNGVNVIIGDTDSGKSNIMRCFDWVLNNSPSGESMRSEWGGDTEGIVTFNDGTVKRLRTDSRNEYQINDDKPFKSFGSAVPIEVAELINMTQTNFERQFDTPFIIGWSPGDRGRFINEICNFKQIDESISYINKMIWEERQVVKETKSNIEELESQLEEFEDLDQLEKDIEKLEKIEERVLDLTDKQIHLQELIGKTKKRQKDIAKFRDFLKIEGVAKGLDTITREIGQLHEQKYELERLIDEIINTQEDIYDLKKSKAELNNELKRIMPDECPICGNDISWRC